MRNLLFILAIIGVALIGCATTQAPAIQATHANIAANPVAAITTEIVVDFAFDSFELSKESKQKIREAVQENERISWTLVRGHTSSPGSDEHNTALADRRARAAADYLATLGVVVPAVGIRPAQDGIRAQVAVIVGTAVSATRASALSPIVGEAGQQYAVRLDGRTLKFTLSGQPAQVELVGDFMPTGWARTNKKISDTEVAGLKPGQYRFGAFLPDGSNVLPYWEDAFGPFRIPNGQGGYVLALTVKEDGKILPGLQ